MRSNIDQLTDELLAVEWDPRFESFTTKETAFLARYNDFAWLLGNRSFFREPSRLSITASTTLTHAGTESQELAAITLRQRGRRATRRTRRSPRSSAVAQPARTATRRSRCST